MIRRIFGFLNKKKYPLPKNGRRLILIVEDNEEDRGSYKRVVHKMGHRSTLADNGETGLTLARTLRPDIILTNCHLPLLSGTEMCRRLKEDEQTKNIPVLFLTEDDTPKNILDCFDLDAENFLSKPVSSKLLASEIQMILNDYVSSRTE